MGTCLQGIWESAEGGPENGPQKKKMRFIKDDYAESFAVFQGPEKRLGVPASVVSRNDINLSGCMSIGPQVATYKFSSLHLRTRSLTRAARGTNMTVEAFEPSR